MLVILAVFAVLITALFIRYSARSSSFPPGPRGLPLLGSLPWINVARQEEFLLPCWRQYGDIFTVPGFAGTKSVVLADADLIKEAFSNVNTVGRKSISAGNDLFYMDCGLIFSTGESWQHRRRFTLHNLRNLGMGRSRLEAVVQDQVLEFIDQIVAPSVGQSINIQDSLNIAVANIIWSTVSSKRFNIRDQKALSVMKSTDETGKQGTLIIALVLFPWIQYLPQHWIGLDRLRASFEKPLDNLIKPAIREHEQTFSKNGEPRDYIDALLQEQARDPRKLTDRHMARCIFDLFLAGSDTTKGTLRWAFCLLAKYPEEQTRMRQELHQQLGEKQPTLADRYKLPFTEAVIMEVQRMANIAPCGVEHVVEEQIKLKGYTLTKGTVLVSLLAAVHMDPNNFENPEEFRPSRFLDSEGKLKPSRFLMPFSVGRRACLGESLARAELFLFLTCILQKYHLRFPHGFHHDLGVLPHKMLIREPKPYDLVFEEATVTS